MRVFSVSFEISKENSVAEVLGICLLWRKNNTATAIGEEIDAVGDYTEGEVSLSCDNEQVDIHLMRKNDYELGYFSSVMVVGEEAWTSVCLARKNADKFIISFTTDYVHSSVQFTVPDVKKPYVFKLWKEKLKSAADYCFLIDGKAKYLDDDATGQDVTRKIINQECSFSLPVVYISKSRDDKYFVNPDTLAALTYGMAHVVVAPRVGFVRDCCASTEIPHGGAIACFDRCASVPWVFLPKDGDFEQISVKRIFNRVRFFWIARQIPVSCSVEHYKDVVFQNNIDAICDANRSTIAQIRKEYERRIDEKNALILKQESESKALISHKLDKGIDPEAEPLLFYGDESDFFDDEIFDTIIEVLTKYQSQFGGGLGLFRGRAVL
ncbi:hypothetical protein K9F62_02250 [Desulfovibrio sp. JY]|nr:hypothetical protein K9F62_02250 [Desulfovibrio sp. JY]